MYIGRFAPSPSGPLHFGSLVAAVASYLDAQAHKGKWLVRIEDLDTPRCDPKYAEVILASLASHGMVSDDKVVYQSTRLQSYQQALQRIQDEQDAYYCQCSRKQIKQQGGVYLRHCLGKQHQTGSIRFFNQSPTREFYDRFYKKVVIDEPHALEDFIIKRKDGIFSYNFAVVVDDIAQNISHVVRGDDLLTTTSAHLSLYAYFKHSAPKYAHIKVIKDANGAKLSKQNHAPAIDSRNALNNLYQAFAALGLTQVQHAQSCAQALSCATTKWQQKHMLGDSLNIK